ncbi:orphan sodium- and chloride-dependent neurotransmitter transporter NTT5 [Tenrec ecaudatus]|uniref:orphan sodium- and chloride-dependent neurotransmitter transporter NTT5 n=1 Tax=Tenrec ecaudatus TaxID=94439 RepID=UPI003F598804
MGRSLGVQWVAGPKLYTQRKLRPQQYFLPWQRGPEERKAFEVPGLNVCIIQSILKSVANCWCLLYLSQSFQFPLPWEKCPLVKNSSDFDAECARTTPFMYFWYRQTLKISDTIEDDGTLISSVSLSLFVTWCFIGAIMMHGIKILGKVMYVLVLLPYLIMVCFLIWSPLLNGSLFGLQHLLKFKKVSVLDCFMIIINVGNHLLSSLGLGLGIIAAFSSYLPPSNNCLVDAVVVALVNLGTMLMTTAVIIFVVGFWVTITTNRCKEKNVEVLINLVSLGELPPEAMPPANIVSNVASMFTSWLESLPQSVKKMVQSKVSQCNTEDQIMKTTIGPGFTFLLFVETMSFVPGAAYWSILFFLMYLSFGMTAIVGNMQGIFTPLQDTFSGFKNHPKLLTVSVTLLLFLGSLFFAQPPGYYYFRLLDDYWFSFPTVLLPTMETMGIAWIYGAKR